MRDTVELHCRGCDTRRAGFVLVALVALGWGVAAALRVEAAEQYDPFEARPRFHDPFEAQPNPPSKSKQQNRKRIVRDPFDEVARAASKRAALGDALPVTQARRQASSGELSDSCCRRSHSDQVTQHRGTRDYSGTC